MNQSLEKPNYSPELLEKASKVKAIAFDSLGVLFPAEVFMSVDNREFIRQRSHVDGQGISYLRAIGIFVAFITSEKTGFVEVLGNKLNSLPSVKSGAWEPIAIMTGDAGKDKVAALTAWLAEHGLTMDDCAYVGDEAADVKIFEKVGFSVAPAQAERRARAHADFVTERNAGAGAIRDIADLLLEARGIDPLSLSRS